MALCLLPDKSLSVEQQTPRGTLRLVITEVRLEPKRKETDCTAHEHDLVVGSLSGIYGSKKRLLV